jgi:cardiolipin synthase
MPMLQPLLDAWPWIVSALGTGLALVASGHAVLYKRDPRSAIGWVGLIWLVPYGGVLLYFLFGINRIQRRAARLRRRRPRLKPDRTIEPESIEALARTIGSEATHLHALAQMIGKLTGKPLLRANRIAPLHNGEQAYPAMTAAIDAAKHSVALSTYIFDNDRAGDRFIDALRRAAVRGVDVRVLIDDVGVHYTWPTVVHPLRRAGVKAALFLPKLLPWYSAYFNLCNHRKLLIADGRVGFTGGMNIREGHDLTLKTRHPVQDMHFQVEGPVVAQLQEEFAGDWHFCTGETIHGEAWFPRLEAAGTVPARGIASGPDDDFEKLRMTYLGALTCARERVRIVTPYFLPDDALVAALGAAALRGVRVDILIPEQNNLRLVQWASTAMLNQVLEHGCRVWLNPVPFDHTKLLLVDGAWALIGSANWDPRSLELNFEFDLECYDAELAGRLEAHVTEKLNRARPVTLAGLRKRSLPIKLRDGIAWLFTPYL